MPTAGTRATDFYDGPDASRDYEYDEYGRPIQRAAPSAPMGQAQTGFSSFAADPSAPLTASVNAAQVSSGQGQLSPQAAGELARRLAALPEWAREQARPGLMAQLAKNPQNLAANQPQSAPADTLPAAAHGSQVGQDAAKQALSLLSPIAQQGFTSADMMGINAANNASALQSRAMIQSLAQQAQMRGAGQGGVGQMQQAQAAQQAANFGNQQGAQIGMAANDRRMNAISGLAQVGFGTDAMATGHQQAIDEDYWRTMGAQSGATQQAFENKQTIDAQPKPWERALQAVTGIAGTAADVYSAARPQPSGGGR